MKKGISLIVLVITIIVMIILAGVVIMSISNNNVIDKANTAVSDYNQKLIEDQIQLTESNYYLKNKKSLSQETVEDLRTAMTTYNIPMEKLFLYEDVAYTNASGAAVPAATLVLFDYSKVTEEERTALLQAGYLYLKGDVNMDNKITIEDITMASSISVGYSTATPLIKAYGDMNNDTVIDALDVTMIDLLVNGHTSLRKIFE